MVFDFEEGDIILCYKLSVKCRSAVAVSKVEILKLQGVLSNDGNGEAYEPVEWN